MNYTAQAIYRSSICLNSCIRILYRASMDWPTPQDYSEATQNPKTAFRDPDLRDGTPELDLLGLPRPRSGSFAVVYKIQGRQSNWAVKCFLRDVPDQEQRYLAIFQYLSKVRLPFLVGFHLLAEGIRVGRRFYPVLKMEWIEGDPLHIYVQKHLFESGTLRNLAMRWSEMTKALRGAGVAHGDLQQGNILVVNDDLRLVDYDGMYVPSLSNFASNEIGHSNYQHPDRNANDFGPYLDNFSAWVIYTSLIALSYQPKLWQEFQGGDDCLIFRRKDLEDPDNSKLFDKLETLPDEQARSLVGLFKSLRFFPVCQVPTLDGQFFAPASLSRPPSAATSSWVNDYVNIAPTGISPTQNASTNTLSDTNIDPSWIFDFSAEAQRRVPDALAFKNPLKTEQLIAALSVAALFVVFIVCAAFGSISVGVLIVFLIVTLNCALWVRSFHREPGLAEIKALKSKLDDVDAQLRSAGRDLIP